MSSADKMGIAVAIGIVAAAVGFTLTGGTGVPSDIPQKISPAVEQVKELREDIEPAVEKMKQVAEEAKQVLEETQMAREKGMEMVEELATSKLPARLVSIPQGTSVIGCEEVNLCYDPPSLIIFVDGEIIWRNDDSSSHTVTSGSVFEGPNGIFDSGLMRAGDTFSHRFDESGVYQYFCMIHPWATGSVTVK